MENAPELGSDVNLSCYWGENEDNKDVNWYAHRTHVNNPHKLHIMRIKVAREYSEPDVLPGFRNKVSVETVKVFNYFIPIAKLNIHISIKINTCNHQVQPGQPLVVSNSSTLLTYNYAGIAMVRYILCQHNCYNVTTQWLNGVRGGRRCPTYIIQRSCFQFLGQSIIPWLFG